jgi:hypothetical protein
MPHTVVTKYTGICTGIHSRPYWFPQLFQNVPATCSITIESVTMLGVLVIGASKTYLYVPQWEQR